MKIPELAPLIDNEPQASQVRVLSINKAPVFNKFPSFPLLSTTSTTNSCKCPQVLIADDDTFQHLYYNILFQKSFNSKDLSPELKPLKVQLCFSGEELLECHIEVRKCGCKRLILMIIDYQMGKGKLNGIDTSFAVRKSGYNGFVLLRTSETQESLKFLHGNFDEILEDKIISAFVVKTDLRQGKEIIQSALKAMKI